MIKPLLLLYIIACFYQIKVAYTLYIVLIDTVRIILNKTWNTINTLFYVRKSGSMKGLSFILYIFTILFLAGLLFICYNIYVFVGFLFLIYMMYLLYSF